MNNSSLLQALAIHDYSINDNATFTSGLQFISRKIVSNDRGNHEVSNAGAFGTKPTDAGGIESILKLLIN